jgi:nucleotide-binding universal stress UspA family protein
MKSKIEPLINYKSILLAVDSSEHSDKATNEAVKLAKLCDAKITATHVYAAKLHDIRFRQMEGGLPEQYRREKELEKQRETHDDLITRGLSIITDSYLIQVQKACDNANINYENCPLEGKNYRELTQETNNGNYDLLVMGSLGVGAIAGSKLGSVCERVSRRTNIDTLIIKQLENNVDKGSIVVAIDGSERSYGGLITAISLAKHWQVDVKVVAAFDPYFHYVAFNRIAGVLSEEAGKIFKFKEQEKLHEEIIDSGLAKIYQGHLDIAKTIVEEYGVEIETKLLDGKPYDAIKKYCDKINPSLLIIGKLGIHADNDLDIGGNTEQLLRNINCAVLLSQRTYKPRLDVIADVTTSWSKEAEERLQKAPSFVRNMARMAILRYAQERNHTVITARIVDEATAKLMPSRAEEMIGEIVNEFEALTWDDEAQNLLNTITDKSLRDNVSKRAEKKARQSKSKIVIKEHIVTFLENPDEKIKKLHWQTAALARLMRIPEGFMRDSSRKRIEELAHKQNNSEVDLKLVEEGLFLARQIMEKTVLSNK